MTRSQGDLVAGDVEAPTVVLKCRRAPTSGDPIVTLGGKLLRPDYSQEVRNLSREGFGWGYRGAAPAQMALAVLLEVTYTEEALRLYQPFKERFVAPMHYIGGEMPVATIKSWLEDKRAEEAGARERLAATHRKQQTDEPPPTLAALMTEGAAQWPT